MKNAKRGSAIVPAGFFVVRSPLLEADAGGSDPESLLAARPFVREATLRASPSLVEALDGKRRSRGEYAPALRRYLERMRSRSTPFSLMAGYALGDVGGPTTEIRLAAQSEYLRFVRLDRDCIADVVRRGSPPNDPKVEWIARRDLVLLPDCVRSTTRLPGEHALRSEELGRSAAVDAAISEAKSPRTIATLSSALAERLDVTEAAAEAFVRQLVERGVLVPADLPPVMADDELASLDRAAPSVSTAARGIRFSRLVDPVDDALTALAEATEKSGHHLEAQDLLFDLWKPAATATLGDDAIDALTDVVDVLQRTTLPIADRRIERFCAAFTEKFGSREMPLAEALTPGRGIPFPAEPLDAVDATGETEREHARWLVDLYRRAVADHAREILLDASNLPDRATWQLPDSFAMVFELLVEPLSVWRPTLLGSPGTSRFARATALSEELRDRTRAWIARVAARRADVDFAEIAYALPVRVAAPTQFPLLRTSEIVVSEIGAGGERSFDANDLLLSVRSGRPRIRSAMTGREIVPCSTSAVTSIHPEMDDLARFLFGVAHVHSSRRWRWGILDDSETLPRVRYRDHVLAPARWRLGAKRLGSLHAAKTKAARYDLLQQARAELELPAKLRFEEQGDQSLAVDLDDPESVEAFADLLRGTTEAVLTEQTPFARSAIRGPEGVYQHEIVVPFESSRAPTEADTRKRTTLPPAAIESSFQRVIPGNDVLCMHVAGDRDELAGVVAAVAPALSDIVEANGSWFFEPLEGAAGFRLVAFGAPALLYGTALPALHEALAAFVADRVVSRVALESYDRDLRARGPVESVTLQESLWWRSSEIAIETYADGRLASDARDNAAEVVRSLASVLALSGLTLDERIELVTQAAEENPSEDPHVSKRLASEWQRQLSEESVDWYAEAPLEIPSETRELFAALRELDPSRLYEHVLDVARRHVARMMFLGSRAAAPSYAAECFHLLARVLKKERALAR